MREVIYELVLASDAEPGTGLGGLFVDQVVPRGQDERPEIRGTHIKGLVRTNLERIAEATGWPIGFLVDPILGCAGGRDLSLATREQEGVGARPGASYRDPSRPPAGIPGRAYFTNAILGGHIDGDVPGTSPFPIYRTAISESGGAKTGSLRGSEAIPKGTVFTGTIRLLRTDLEREIVILGLRTLTSIGSNRQRGAGACFVRVRGDERKPSQLLQSIESAIRDFEVPPTSAEATQSSEPPPQTAVDSTTQTLESKATWYQLVFEADDTICCPEVPVTGGTNVIRSGIAIPSSAVMGAVLTAISRRDPQMASRLVTREDARFWPLLPAPEIEGHAPTPSWSSLTLRISKERQGERHAFADTTLSRDLEEGVRWKGCEGVVLDCGSNGRFLWRHQDIPRKLTAHAVPKDHNLYSVEAIAVRRWAGLLALPETAGRTLAEVLDSDPYVVLGKSRGVRGLGKLSLERIDEKSLEFGGPEGSRVFVAQSPIAVPDDWTPDLISRSIAHSQTNDLADSGPPHAVENWLLALAQEDWGAWQPSFAVGLMACQFGWNRVLQTDRVPRGYGRLRARRVFRPGAIVVLDRAVPVEQMSRFLLQGLGQGRDRGFGAVLPYTQLPADLYYSPTQPLEVRSDGAGGIQAGFALTRLGVRFPSASQASSLLAFLQNGSGRRVTDFLSHQRTRGTAGWIPWKAVADDLRGLDELPETDRVRALQVWRDWLTIRKESRRRR